MRMRLTALLLAFSLLSPTVSYAATKKPTPKATTKATTKKPVVKKPVTSTTKKPVAKKPVVKKPVKKSVRRVYKRKRVAPIPSPKPKWPPANFHVDAGIYLKVAITGKELTGVLAAAGKTSQLYKDSQTCASQVCGVIQVASEDACYWEVDSVLYGADNATLGNLRTFSTRSWAKKVTTIFLITPQPIADGYRVAPVTAKCWTIAPPETLPSNIFNAITG